MNQYTAIQYQNEGSLYAFPAPVFVMEEKTHSSLLKFAKLTAILGILILFISYLPGFISSIQQSVSTRIAVTANEAYANAPESTPSYQPVFDSSLPATNEISIPSIGVSTKIEEASHGSYEDALKKGVWRVTDFGTPTSSGKPIIMAAHRFGYLKWSNDYRQENSFYNLPKLAIGETIEVNWRQRKYVYKVYGESKGSEIEDYSADLVLYTCNDLLSDTRIVKYAKLLEV